MNKRLGCFGRKLLLRWAVGGVVTGVGESLQATSLVSLNPLETTPWLSESEKYSLLHTQREIELTESEKYTVGGVGERLHATSSLVVVAGQVKPALQSEHHTLPFLFHTTTLLLCHKLDFYKQYFSKLYFYTTPCLSFSTPPHFCSATQ